MSANTPHAVHPHAANIIQVAPCGSIDDPLHPPQRVRFHTPLLASFDTSPPASPTPSDDPDPPSPWAPDQADSPATSPATDHHIFAVYQRDTAVSFIPDSGATHILIRESDADILSSVAPFPPYTRRPHFEVANKQFIVPFASGVIAFPNSDVTLRAYIFRDHDLADNLFGIAPLLRHGYTATFTDNDFSLHTSGNILLYGTKTPLSNTWRFSLPRPNEFRAAAVIRHEQHAEVVLFAYATFGSPSYQAFYHAVQRGWLHNYPNLTPDMVRRNKPHVPAYALGHIQASRSGVRSTRTHQTAEEVLSFKSPIMASAHSATSSLDDEILHEYLADYPEAERPNIKLLATIHPSSKFRDEALFSDLAGRFPVTAFDGSQYIMISQYKSYIHAELLPSRTEASLGAAFTRTYRFFKDHGHQILFQVLDNECPASLMHFFEQQHVVVDRVPPHQKRANKAERAIQTFRNHFLSILVGTHPNFPINQWHHLLPQAEATLNMMHAWPDNFTISAYHGIHRRPYDFLSHPMAPCGTLLVAHDPGGEKWDNHGRIGFYLGPALTHYRAYHCFIADTNSTRICDSVMFYPAPLVLPGASRFDQLLHLTEQLVTAAEHHPPAPHDQPVYAECLQMLKEFLLPTLPTLPTARLPTPLRLPLRPHVTARAPTSASTWSDTASRIVR